jgi:hypothetical protein
MQGCERCGLVVGINARDSQRHAEWHDEIERISSTADDALDRAEQTQNTLYQNNIEI